MQKEKINIPTGEWIKAGFDLYKNNIGLLIGAAAIAYLIIAGAGLIAASTAALAPVLMVATMCLVVAPMVAGLFYVTLSVAAGQQPKATDVFKGFSEYFSNAVIFWLISFALNLVLGWILGVIPVVGALLSLALGVAIHAVMIFGMPMIVERNTPPTEAVKQGLDIFKMNPGGMILFSILAAIVGGCGSLILGIGVILTMPIYFCSVAVAYRELSSDPATVQSAKVVNG